MPDTKNSAIRGLEADGILYLKQHTGRSKKVILTDKGKDYVQRTSERLSCNCEYYGLECQRTGFCCCRVCSLLVREGIMRIQLSDHFTYRKLMKFTLPSIAMMIFTSIYGVVDGFFVSNFSGKTSFAAVNFIMPFLMIVATVGFMFGTGGTAIVAKTFGEGDSKRASEYFSLFTYVSFFWGFCLPSSESYLFVQSLQL